MSHLAIVGAGAAGLYAAGSALALGHRVTLIEHMESPGKKLLTTGKGRCNVTNNCDEEEFLKNVRHNPRFLYSALYALPPRALMEVLENEYGLPLKTERGRRVFPQSDRAADVLQVLQKRAQGAKMVHARAKSLLIENQQVTGVVLEGGQTVHANAVLVATGGLSYSITGSTGIGYTMARGAGHAIVPPEPSLVSLLEKGSTCRKLMGLSLRNVTLTLLEDNKAVFSELGEMLFTHFGISGPLTLSSSAFTGDFKKHTYVASVDMKPALSAEKLDERIRRDFTEMASKNVTNCLDKLLPGKMRSVMLERWGVPPDTKVNQITRQQREELVKLIKGFTVPLAGRGDLAHAVITSGGVDVKQVDPKTMQSKLVQGLYFAGEVLDVDAYTGGYNLQIAFSTADAAARGFDAAQM